MQENPLVIECAGIGKDGRFLAAHTGRGEDASPAFVLKNLSPQAKSLVITLEDLSHPVRGFTHWVIWNIPAADSVPARIPAGAGVLGGAVQGIGYGFHRYAGPKPPRGTSHQYRFTVYALDGRLPLGAFSTKRKVLRTARGHILQRGETCGYFE